MFTKYGKKITDARSVMVDRVEIPGGRVRWMLSDSETGDRLCSRPNGLGYYVFDKLNDALDTIAMEL